MTIAHEEGFESTTFRAEADMQLFQYSGVRVSGADLCNVASDAADANNFGVLINKPNSGEFATVAYKGIVRGRAAAAITVNDLITFQGSGLLVAATSGDYVIGRALIAAGGANEIISVLVHPPYANGDVA